MKLNTVTPAQRREYNEELGGDVLHNYMYAGPETPTLPITMALLSQVWETLNRDQSHHSVKPYINMSVRQLIEAMKEVNEKREEILA